MKRKYVWLMIVMLSLFAVVEAQNRPPVADAGSSRYAAREAVTLDGSDSYDPDGDTPLIFRWRQVSGPPVVIGGENTAAPSISGFVPTTEIQTCVFELTVGDGVEESRDTVSVFIVPDYGDGTLSLQNPPFEPDRPTILAFTGGDCSCGGSMYAEQPPLWYIQANYITGPYCPPYSRQADELLVYLSRVAPDYRQAIQTVGFSTGGNPAMMAANHLNGAYMDPRFAVNRVSLIDAPCIDFPAEAAWFHANPVGGEAAWVDTYRVTSEFIPGAVNISFPGGSHETPFRWLKYSASADNWVGNDMYNNGVTAGYYFSVIGPGRNFRPVTDDTPYFFRWVQGRPPGLELRDSSVYPGRIPRPVKLLGPADGAAVGENGALLTCENSDHAVAYQLLFGADPRDMSTVVSVTPEPPTAVITQFPFNPTYWTVRAVDALGSTIHADPIALYTGAPSDRPFVAFDHPARGSTVSGTVELSLQVRDSHGIHSVKFYVDGRLKHTAYAAPWTWSWDTSAVSNKPHLLRAAALNREGFRTEARRSVAVENMTITLHAERKTERSWLMQKEIGDLTVTVDNPGNLAPVETYAVYRKIKGAGTFQEFAEVASSQFQGGVFHQIDVDIEAHLFYIYRVEALAADGRVLAFSQESSL